MKPKEILCLINWVCFVVSSVAGLAFEQVHGVVRRVATDQADPCLPSNHRNISHIGNRNINVRGSCPYTDGRLEDAWYYAGQNPISSYRHIPEMCSCGYKFPIWMNGTMPGVAEGVVSRTTCMRFGPFTCDQTINIQIKNCGNMFVYHLSATPDDAGYCFDVTTASIISSASSPSSASSTITTSQTTATSTQDATTAISTSTGIPHTSASGSMSTSQTTGRYTEKSTTTSRRSPNENATVTSVAQTTSQTTTTTSTGTSTTTVKTSPYYIHFTTSVTRSTSQTATKSTEDATTTSRTPPYTTTNASSTSSTNQTATISTKKYSEQKTTVAYVYNATRLTSFSWSLSTTKSFWYEITTPGTKPQDAIFVNCNELGWNIRIDMNRLREIYPNAKSSDIYLGENTCTGVLSWNTVTFQQGLKECLTSQTVRENAIVYSNELVYAERDPNFAFIIRHYNWTVRVECDVRRNETSSGHIHHESNNVIQPTVTGNSHFSVNMSFYSDINFMYQLQGNPLHVTVGDKVYVKIYATTSDWTVKMRVHTCYTKPEQFSADNMKYYIIQNGCAVDKNTHIISESTHETRFVFQDFEYTSNHEGIHVFCDAVFCGSHDMSCQFQTICNPVVRRRNIDIGMIDKE